MYFMSSFRIKYHQPVKHYYQNEVSSYLCITKGSVKLCQYKKDLFFSFISYFRPAQSYVLLCYVQKCIHRSLSSQSVSIIVVSKHITVTTTYTRKYAMAAVVVLHGKEKMSLQPCMLRLMAVFYHRSSHEDDPAFLLFPGIPVLFWNCALICLVVLFSSSICLFLCLTCPFPTPLHLYLIPSLVCVWIKSLCSLMSYLQCHRQCLNLVCFWFLVLVFLIGFYFAFV